MAQTNKIGQVKHLPNYQTKSHHKAGAGWPVSWGVSIVDGVLNTNESNFMAGGHVHALPCKPPIFACTGLPKRPWVLGIEQGRWCYYPYKCGWRLLTGLENTWRARELVKFNKIYCKISRDCDKVPGGGFLYLELLKEQTRHCNYLKKELEIEKEKAYAESLKLDLVKYTNMDEIYKVMDTCKFLMRHYAKPEHLDTSMIKRYEGIMEFQVKYY